jgi:hypothetical protein
MTIMMDTSELERILKNTAQYCEGFIAGGEDGLSVLLMELGQAVKEALELWMDSMAAGNHAALHHVYEWYQAGSAGARLFEYNFSVGGGTIVFTGETQASSSLPHRSTVPFYNKADVMESGQSVTISPINVEYLHWDDVYTPNDVTVTHPGGAATVGSWKRFTDLFFNTVLSQALLATMLADLAVADEFTASFAAGANGGGFGAGQSAGYKWITSPDIGVIA